jgi:hypothetical protein
MDKETLKKRLAPILNFAADSTRNLILLLSGFGITLFGLGLVLIAEYLFGNTITQEVIAAIGVVLIGVGLSVAAIGYLCLSVLSLIRYLLHEPTDRSPKEVTSSATKTDDHSPSTPLDQSESH